MSLVVFNFAVGVIIGIILNLPGYSDQVLAQHLKIYLLTALITITLGPPVAFFALAGKGYLAPLGFVIFIMIFSQIIAAFGMGTYFPWSIPALFSGAAGDYKEALNTVSYAILVFTSVAGYLITVFWWKYADQAK
jgi:ABC-2 type transport system permease protein